MTPPNDPTAFVRLLLQHQDALLRFIVPLVCCLDDAQDVLQETAAALWKKFDRYDPAQPFLPWARQFARHEVLMHHRSRRRYTFLTEALIDQLADRTEERETLAQERADALTGCLQTLSAEDRSLLQDRYGEAGRSMQQVAAEVGTSVNVLYKSLARIRRQLLLCVAGQLGTVHGSS